MKILHLFRNDLRLADNDAIVWSVENGKSLSFLYVLDERFMQKNAFGIVPIGENRMQFIKRALFELKQELSTFGHNLTVLEGNTTEIVSQLVSKDKIEALSVCDSNGFYELEDVNTIKKLHPQLIVCRGESHYLYEESSFPFSLENMPDTFSPFRRKVEKYCEPRSPCDDFDLSSISGFVPSVEGMKQITLENTDFNYEHSVSHKGAFARINQYFYESDGIASYKITRNGLDGWDFSSRLSAFLAIGLVSPAQVVKILGEYEAQRTKNDSTYWLFFELLWREFFQWSHKKHGASFFRYRGINDFNPQTKDNVKHLSTWIEGTTGFPIVDACMRQLKETGFMSNRGRQLVASCFVHELGMDWRYGAAWFEHTLLDFDVASNYGNWQYLAGVGSDPRGHRQFNLEKQTQQYDPEHKFIRKWLS